MKILILHKWLVAGGVERVLINYLSVFKCLNYEVELLITNDLGEKNVFQKELPENTQYRYVFNQTYFNMWEDLRKNRKKSVFNKAKYEIFKLKDQYYYAKTLNNIIKSKDYDLIIDFSGCLDTLIRNAFFNTRSIPTVRWIHGQLNHQGHKRKIRKYQQIFSKHNKVISLCEEMTKVVSQDLRLPADKFTVIYNPLNLKEIEERSQSIKDLSQEKFLLCVTRLVGGKGLIELLEIYAKLKQQGITQKLCLIGDGELKDDLQQKIAELNLTQDVLLLGEMNNPYPYFKAADLFLFCSESEGLPTVLLESMACGTPIVAMDCLTGPKDILGANSEYGKLIPLHDKEKFVNAVLELLENPEIYQYYVEKSHQRIQDFSVEKIRVEVEKLFQEMDLKVR